MIAPQQYIDAFAITTSKIEVTARDGSAMTFDEGVAAALEILRGVQMYEGKIMLIGNGAEASVASHFAVDFWKVGGVKAVTFSDAAQLTALANDRGVESMFSDPVRAFGDPRDALLALSCSGESRNVLEAAAVPASAAAGEIYPVITLTGFDPANSLRGVGDVNFYVPASTYGLCESAHALIMHCILDCWMRRDG